MLEMCARQIDVFGMVEQNVSELEVSARLDPGRRLEVEHRLQTLHTGFDVGWRTRAKVFG